MSSQLSEKIYYRITFSLASALAVGSGKNEKSDKDIILNSLEKPYIPASALTGVYKSLFSEENAKKYFGNVVINQSKEKKNKNYATESRIITYDANLREDNYKLSIRDCVGLDEWKTSVKGAKFDFEILEPGAKFVTYLEENVCESKSESGSELIANAWKNGEISLGAKTSRGFGKLEVESIQKQKFNFDEETEIASWLDFDLYDDKCWEDVQQWSPEMDEGQLKKLGKAKEFLILKLVLKQEGPITIRRYTTEVFAENGKNNIPDYEQLVYVRDKEKIPVIPGTTWAGAFRHHMMQLNKNSVGSVFGKKSSDEKQKDGKKSDVIFSESEIKGAKEKIVTRNGINRFTGGSADGALFTEKMFYGGYTDFVISFNKKKCGMEFRKILAAAIADLNMGVLSVGGETSVGHGIFSVSSVLVENQAIAEHPVESDQLYELIADALTREV